MRYCKQNHLTKNGTCINKAFEPCLKEKCNQYLPYKKIDYIRDMSVEGLAEFIHDITSSIAIKLNGEYVSNETEYIKQWLESEVTDNEYRNGIYRRHY